ncbi:phosphoglycolate phosphatase [Streptococcus infantis SK1302]|uniref:Phosphoglycolate phosphatase n=1 Tax=Streptococcus infantis SK1302 TaxID=871237 RepID=A0ABP2JA00_9STRE|nr:phosphoglycolate phosphatase [Streptococcus infantis SK1302]
MKYHDYIWDLGGTLLDNYETSTAAFVETLAQFGIEEEHDKVYNALKVSTAFAIDQFAPTIEHFLENIRKMKRESLNILPCLREYLLYWRKSQTREDGTF